jgi:integrase
MRQGETTALRVSDFDAEAGTIRINKSRSEGEENDPKTERSIRTIRLLPEALGPLRVYARGRLILKPDAYLFTNPEGNPINHKEWPRKSFYPVLRKLQIRLRDFYSTRDTFISEMLRRGENVKAIAEYCGTSAAMIERSYGRYFPRDLDGGVKTLGGPSGGRGGGAKTVTSTVTSIARAVGDGLSTANDQRKRKWSHGESNRIRAIRR